MPVEKWIPFWIIVLCAFSVIIALAKNDKNQSRLIELRVCETMHVSPDYTITKCYNIDTTMEEINRGRSSEEKRSPPPNPAI